MINPKRSDADPSSKTLCFKCKQAVVEARFTYKTNVILLLRESIKQTYKMCSKSWDSDFGQICFGGHRNNRCIYSTAVKTPNRCLLKTRTL